MQHLLISTQHAGVTSTMQMQTGASDQVDKPSGAHVRAIYRFIYHLIGNREDAEALTTRVFMETPRGDGAHGACDPYRQLLRLARERVADHLAAFYGFSRTAAELLVNDLANNPASGAGKAQDVDSAARLTERAHLILAHLPARERDLLTERFLAGRSLEEIATLLHLTLAEAQALQRQALRHAAVAHEGANDDQ
jgi:RNA polymerase sigma-70 factor (ECF subfamily)